MARRKNSRKQVPEKLKHKQQNEAKLLRHIARLNLRTKESYKAWCAKHGFSTSFVKTDLMRQRELQKHAQLLSVQRLRQHSRESKLRTQIEKISRGEVNSSDLSCEVLLEIFDGFKKCLKPELLLESLLYLERWSKLISNAEYVRGIVALVSHHTSWKRPLNQWRPQKHSVLGSLLLFHAICWLSMMCQCLWTVCGLVVRENIKSGLYT